MPQVDHGQTFLFYPIADNVVPLSEGDQEFPKRGEMIKGISRVRIFLKQSENLFEPQGRLSQGGGVFLFDEGWFQYVRSDSERIFS